jgi:hypothetical protein
MEDKGAKHLSQGSVNDKIHSPTRAAAIVMTPEQLEPTDGETSDLAITNNVTMPPQVAEPADSEQEWEIFDIVGKEDVDGVATTW